MKKYSLVIALLFAAMLIVACQPKAAAGEKIVLGYSPPTLEMTDFYKWGQEGLMRKAAELGLDLEVITKAPSTHAAAEEQLKIIEDFITQGVDYIWTVPVSVEAGDPIFAAAYEAGIPIFAGHAIYENPEELHIINVGTDFLKTGTDVGKFIAQELNCVGPVGIIRGAAGEYDTWRVQSAIDQLALDCPDMTVYTSNYTDWVTENGLNEAKTMVTDHPDIKLIYNPSSTLSMGTVAALDELDLTGEIKVLDYDLIPTIQAMCKQDPPAVIGGLAMFPYKYGEVVAQLIADSEAGKTIPTVTEVPGVVVTCDKLETTFAAWYLAAKFDFVK